MDLGGNRLLTQGFLGDRTLTRALLIGAASAAFLICAVPVTAQTTPSSSATAQASSPQKTAAAAKPIASYPDSPAGLEKLISDMLRMQKDGNATDLAAYTQSLILPNQAAWFTAAFGSQIGTELAADYDRTRIDLPLSFPDGLAELRSKHATKPLAVRFTDSCNADASDTEYPLLLRRTGQQPLYDVRFPSGSQYFSLKYFAYVDGAFRWLGTFQLRAPGFPAPATRVADRQRTATLKVEAKVVAAKLIKQVKPSYPPDALYHGMQGTVILHALIDTDGSVQDLQVLQGTCSFAEASLKAVRQWRYSPTTLNGTPVKVDTTISVVFQLGR